MANPLIPQGELSLTDAAVHWNSYPALNATASNMAEGMVRLGFEGEATRYLRTATGVVLSPQPFLMARLTLSLLKSQTLPAAYLQQLQVTSILGACTVYGDVDESIFTPFNLTNMGMNGIPEVVFNGAETAITFTFTGQYYINTTVLWG